VIKLSIFIYLTLYKKFLSCQEKERKKEVVCWMRKGVGKGEVEREKAEARGLRQEGRS